MPNTNVTNFFASNKTTKTEKPLTYAETAVELAKAVAKNDAHGYSQPNRYGDGGMTNYEVGGKKYQMHSGDFDCSSFVDDVYAAQGLLPRQVEHDDSTKMSTHNEKAFLEEHGFTSVKYDPEKLQPGDVLMWHDPVTQHGHTEIYIGDGKTVGASHGDGPDGTDGVKGDQDGTEILTRKIGENGYNWAEHDTVVLRPPAGPEAAIEAANNATKETTPTDYSNSVSEGAQEQSQNATEQVQTQVNVPETTVAEPTVEQPNVAIA